jgi:hypothetical protein
LPPLSDAPIFQFGRCVGTPAALEALEKAGVLASTYLLRHQRGDWGDMSPSDAKANDKAVNKKLRIFSSYIRPNTGVMIWIITEADRESTTVLLPNDY